MKNVQNGKAWRGEAVEGSGEVETGTLFDPEHARLSEKLGVVVFPRKLRKLGYQVAGESPAAGNRA